MKMILPNANSIATFDGVIPKKNDLPYFRKEKQNYCSMLTNNGDSNYMMLNETGNLIMNLCTGSNSVQDILKQMQNMFPEIAENTLFEDIVKVLHTLTQSNAISWRNKDMIYANPFCFMASDTFSDECTFSLVMEYEIRETVAYIKDAIANKKNEKDFLLYIWGTNHREYGNPVVVRQCLYSYYRDFFVLKSRGRIAGVIIVQPATDVFLNEATIQMIALPSEFIEPSLKSIMDYYGTFPFKKINLLRIQLPIDFCESTPKFVKLIDAIGFSLESLQKGAYLNKDLYSYSANLDTDEK